MNGMAVCGITRNVRTGRHGKSENKPRWDQIEENPALFAFPL